MVEQTQPIILASASPRRHELLKALGLNFVIDSADVEESVEGGLAPGQVVEALALKKARAVAQKYSKGLIIGADTIVVLDHGILGKPLDHQEALSMLMALQGREHKVYSGVAVIDAGSGRTLKGSEVTRVVFRAISQEEAERYAASEEPMGKAGSYAIQGRGAVFVKEIQGDYFNVVGLPLFLLAGLLKGFGLDIV